MALCNKLGNFIRQSISLNSASSMINSIRCMSSSKLFVGGLSFGTDDGSLKDAFSEFGEVVEARVITDRETGRSRGFGFVTYADTESAGGALSSMDGQELNGRNIRVSYANDKPTSGGYRGGDRNFGGGGGYRGGDRNFGGGY